MVRGTMGQVDRPGCGCPRLRHLRIMNGYNFTERVRQTLAFSREEAVRLHHEHVGPEHLLLGLIREGHGVAAAVIENLNVDAAAIRNSVEAIVKTGASDIPTGPDLPYTSRAKKVLEFSMSEAREMKHSYVGTEHLLLGLLREEKGIGAQVLTSFGITLEKARAETTSVLGSAEAAVREPKNPLRMPYMMAEAQGGTAPRDTRLVLLVSAALAWLMGLLLIFNPIGFESSMNIALDDRNSLIAQAQGAVLLGLGAINWLGRRVGDRAALATILYGNFVVHAVSFAIVLRALVRGLIPTAGIGPLAMHVVLAALFFWQLRVLKRS
jgi:hypothetical protein